MFSQFNLHNLSKTRTSKPLSPWKMGADLLQECNCRPEQWRLAQPAETRYHRIKLISREGHMLALALTVTALLFAFLVISGALADLASFRIPNWVCYGLVALFLVKSFLMWLGTPYTPSLSSFRVPDAVIGAAIHFGIALLVLIVCIIFWRRGDIGGGDAKYLAATSLWMGPVEVVTFMVILSALALVMALLLKLSSRWGFLVHAAGLPAFVKRLYSKVEDNQLPYGFPIGIAALIMIPDIFRI
jgi:prepilin peptidase CpaA